MNILIVDDHPLIREGLKSLIEHQNDMKVVGEAANAQSGVELTSRLHPDVVVMDVSMPGMNGAEATRQIRKAGEKVPVLAMTFHDDHSYLKLMLDSGVSGYILKQSSPDELTRAIRFVSQGGVYIDPSLHSGILRPLLNHEQMNGKLKGEHLSEREVEVLKKISRGYSNKEIARDLTISVKTVETYKARAFEKLGFYSKVQLMRHAHMQGWLNDLEK